MTDLFELSMELCRIRDSLREMTGETYEGAYGVRKMIPGSSSHYCCRKRKTNLKEARKRIEMALPRLNAIINQLMEADINLLNKK